MKSSRVSTTAVAQERHLGKHGTITIAARMSAQPYHDDCRTALSLLLHVVEVMCVTMYCTISGVVRMSTHGGCYLRSFPQHHLCGASIASPRPHRSGSFVCDFGPLFLSHPSPHSRLTALASCRPEREGRSTFPLGPSSSASGPCPTRACSRGSSRCRRYDVV